MRTRRVGIRALAVVAVLATTQAGGPAAVARDVQQETATNSVSPATSASWKTWTSAADRTDLLVEAPTSAGPATRTIAVDPTALGQEWLGSGAALTDASVQMLEAGGADAMGSLFDPEVPDGAHLNLVRLPLSATDFSTSSWTWQDGEGDSPAPPPEALAAIEMLGDIEDLNPALAVAGAAWSAPGWMKTSGTLLGGALSDDHISSYGELLEAQVDQLLDSGVPLAAVSLGNEPGHSAADYPTMTATDSQMIELAQLVGQHLDERAVELWAVDHNWEDRDRVDNVLVGAPGHFDRAAFHCYRGSPAEMSGLVIPAIVSECSGGDWDTSWSSTFEWQANNLVTASIDAGSTGLILWNLALDPAHGPHTGGCGDCRGVITVDPATGSWEANPEYYLLAHLARAAAPGARVTGTTAPADLYASSFRNTDGTVGVFAFNASDESQAVEVAVDGAEPATFDVGPRSLFTARQLPPPPPPPSGEDVVLTSDGGLLEIVSPPVRLLDTATEASNVIGSTMIDPSEPLVLPVAGRGVVPEKGVGAVLLTVHADGASAPGHVSVRPTGAGEVEQPDVVYEAGQASTRTVVTRLGTGGSLTVAVSEPVHLLVEVTGWFPEGSGFESVEPAVIHDTRDEPVVGEKGEVHGGMTDPAQPFVLPISGRGGVPSSGAGAVVLRLLADGAEGPGYASVFVGGSAPTTWNSHFGADGPEGNLVVTALSPSGTVNVATSVATHLTVEILGWFPEEIGYIPLRPARLEDSRPGGTTTDGQGGITGIVPPGAPQRAKVAGRERVPADVAAVALVVAAEGQGTAGRLDLRSSPIGGVSFPSDGVSSNLVFAPLDEDGAVVVEPTAAANVVVDLVGYVAPGSGQLSTAAVASRTVLLGSGDYVGPVPDTEIFEVSLTPSADSVEVGDVLVLNPTGASPVGGIGRVLTIDPQTDGRKTVTLARATLQDAFTYGDLSYEGPIGDAFQSRTMLGGTTGGDAVGEDGRGALGFPAFDCGSDHGLSLSLGADMSASVDFRLRWGFGTIDQLRVVVNLGVDFDASLEGSAEFECEIETPKTFFGTFVAGPVILSFHHNLFAEIELQASAAALRYGWSGDISLGAEYVDGHWTHVNEASGKTKGPDFGLVNPSGEFAVVVGHEFSALAYGSIGVELELGKRVGGTVERVDGHYECTVDLGLQVSGEATADIRLLEVSTEIGSKTFGGFRLTEVDCGPIPFPRVSVERLGTAYTNMHYEKRLHSDTGEGPFTWSATGLPPGLTISGEKILGTPTATGGYDVDLTVTDVHGRSVSKSLVLEVQTPSASMLGMLGALVVEPGAGDGGSDKAWYVDKRGGKHHMTEGGTYECLLAQGVPLYSGDITPLHEMTPHEDAQCVRAAPGDIVAHDDGDSYLITSDWKRRWIVDAVTFDCLRADDRNVTRGVPRYWIMDLELAADIQTDCWDAAAARGHVVRADDGSSWYIDLRTGRHWIPDGGTYDCLIAQGRPDLGHRVPRSRLEATTTEYEHAQCVRADPGDLVTHADGDSYLITSDWKRRWIADAMTFHCLEADDHEVVRNVPRYWLMDLELAADIQIDCWDANAARGHVVRADDGSSWYIDLRAGRHWIPDGGTYDCLVAQGRPDLGHQVPRAVIEDTVRYEDAQCVHADPGDIIVHDDGDSYLITGSWTRRWIPDAPTFVCRQARGGDVVRHVPRYYIEDITAGADLSHENCIVRNPSATSYYINDEGKREWIPDTPTWDCVTGRGVGVINASSAFIGGVPEVGWHYCLNPAQLVGKILSHTDGDSSYIHPDHTRTWIPDGPTYDCRRRQGKQVAVTRWREYVQHFTDTGWDYCYDIETLKGRVVSHPDGDSHFVGANGVRHWIPSGAVFNCLVGRGIPHVEVRWRDYIDRTHEREWAVCGSTITHWQRLDRGQWLSSGSYRLHMQTDGNLVLYNGAGAAIWATHRTGDYVVLQSDGNLVQYTYGGTAVWASGTTGSGADRLAVQSDGNLVLYAGSSAVWATHTVGR